MYLEYCFNVFILQVLFSTRHIYDVDDTSMMMILVPFPADALMMATSCLFPMMILVSFHFPLDILMMMMTRLLFTRYIDDGDNDGDDYDVYLCMFTVVFESTFDRHIDDDDALMMMRQPRTDPSKTC